MYICMNHIEYICNDSISGPQKRNNIYDNIHIHIYVCVSSKWFHTCGSLLCMYACILRISMYVFICTTFICQYVHIYLYIYIYMNHI